LPSAGYRLARSTLGPGIGSGALSPERQTTTMPHTPVTAYLNETLDVKVNLFSKGTLDPVIVVNYFPELIYLIFSKVAHFGIRADTGLGQNLLARCRADAVNVL